MSYEIVGKPESIRVVREDFESFIHLLEAKNIPHLKVLFGFAWGNYIYEKDWLEMTLSPKELRERVQQAELNKDGTIGNDDLFIKVDEFFYERLYCHEADIHLSSEAPNEFTEREKSRWLEKGWKVYEKTDQDWCEIKI
jgi:hypothetical protein